MTAVEITNLLKDYGPWGLVGLFGYVIYSLYKDLKSCNATAIADRDKLLAAQHAAATAAEKVAALLDGIRTTLVAHKEASEDLTKQVELAAQETRHSLANVSAALNGISGQIDRGRDHARGRP